MKQKRFIFILALLCTFAGTAWAVDVTLSEDNDFAMNEAGHWYLNMAPKNDSYFLTLTADDIAAGKGTFKVYDDGGKNGNYTGQSNGYLYINVPSGYILQVSGTVWTKGYLGQGVQEGGIGVLFAYLAVYNGNNSNDANQQMIKAFSLTDGEETSFDAVTTTVNAMCIRFKKTGTGETYQGFDLTVTVFENTLYTIDVADGITNGTLVSSASSAYAHTNITLTPTPDEGRYIGTVSYNDGTDHVIKPNSNNVYSFKMPQHNVTVSATFLDDVGYYWGEGNDGSAEHPYVISNKAGWDLLVTKSQNLLFGLGLHFRLDANISGVTKGLRYFYGHLDGNHHKITLDDTEKEFIYWAMDCPISDLTLQGTVRHEYIFNEASTPVLTNCVFNVSRSGSETLSGLTNQGTVLSTKCVYLLDGVATFAYDENQSLRIPAYSLTIEGGAKAIRTGGTVIGGGTATMFYDDTATIFANGFTLDGTEYYQQNATVTLGSPAGMIITAATYNGNAATINSDGTATFTMPSANVTVSATLVKNVLTLADDADNTIEIQNAHNKVADVTLTGRTLYKDGTWNTLCLPFDVVLAGSPLEGADVRELTSADLNNGTLTLNFSEDLTAIEAGKPYIIKWAEADPIVNPVFAGVTIDADADTQVSFDGGKFVGTYDPFTITSENRNSILYVGSNNKIGYRKTVPYDLGAFRAHFELKVGAEARSVVMNFEEDGEATVNLSPTLSQGEGAWYTLDGRKLNDAPTQRGTYIQGHKKVMIK